MGVQPGGLQLIWYSENTGMLYNLMYNYNIINQDYIKIILMA